MRIEKLSLQNHAPIRSFKIQTSSSVVIIAGANGSGKTRLKEALANTFRSPRKPQASLTLRATQTDEETAWGSTTLEVQAGQACNVLTQYFGTRQREKAYTGTAIQIDSDRAVQPVQFESYTLATQDPDDLEVSYSWYLDRFVGRWQRLVNNIYKKSAARDQKISKFVKENPTKMGSEALTENPDPFVSYQEMFARLLPGKTLETIDPKAPREFHYRIGNSSPMPFDTLSSGEREVVKVAFDLVWKRITHSIILIDEPELHLHPTLTFRLIETLKEFGGGTNQLFLFTHSADLISTYYATGNVFFIDSSSTEPNQAHQLSALSSAHASVLRAASANLGLFAVGKRLVFVEGREASVDRLIYHKVAQSTFSDSYVMPIGSVENIVSLRSVVDEVSNAIFGIDLFLIRDRDGLTDETVTLLERNPRFRSLGRRHVENYLLDAEVLAQVAEAFYLPSEARKVSSINDTLHQIASSNLLPAVLWNVREQIRILGSISQPSVSNLDKMSRDDLAEALSLQIGHAIGEISSKLNPAEIRKLVIREHAKLNAALESNEWVSQLPGKLIFNRFCGEFFKVEAARVREAYADIAMKNKPDVFKGIAEHFMHFSRIATPI